MSTHKRVIEWPYPECYRRLNSKLHGVTNDELEPFIEQAENEEDEEAVRLGGGWRTAPSETNDSEPGEIFFDPRDEGLDEGGAANARHDRVVVRAHRMWMDFLSAPPEYDKREWEARSMEEAKNAMLHRQAGFDGPHFFITRALSDVFASLELDVSTEKAAAFPEHSRIHLPNNVVIPGDGVGFLSGIHVELIRGYFDGEVIPEIARKPPHWLGITWSLVRRLSAHTPMSSCVHFSKQLKPGEVFSNVVANAGRGHETTRGYKITEVATRIAVNTLLYYTSKDPDILRMLNSEYDTLLKRRERADSDAKRESLDRKLASTPKNEALVFGLHLLDLQRRAELDMPNAGPESSGRDPDAPHSGRHVVEHDVRAHWRWQACGEGLKEHRLTLVRPHRRGTVVAPIGYRVIS